MGIFGGAVDALFGPPPSLKTHTDGSFGGALMSSFRQAFRPPKKSVEEILNSFNTVPRIRSISDRVASSVASAEWQAFKITDLNKRNHFLRKMAAASREMQNVTLTDSKDTSTRDKVAHRRADVLKHSIAAGDAEPLDSHPALDLLEMPNPEMTGFQMRHVMQVWLELVGEGFLVADAPMSSSTVTELWPTPPHFAKELPGRGRATYRFEGDGLHFFEVEPEKVLWFKTLDPVDPYGRGSGIAQTLANEMDADEAAALTLTNRLKNHGMPEFIVALAGLEDDGIKALEETWMQKHRGFPNVGIPHFTNSENLKVEKFDVKLAELELVEERDFFGKIFRETWAAPPEIMGVIENSNRATIDAAFFLYAMLLLVPRLTLWENMINWKLVRGLLNDPTTVLLFTSPVPEDREFARSMIQASPVSFAIDEVRAVAGREATPGGDKHPVPNKVDLRLLTDEPAEETPPAPSDEEQEQLAGALVAAVSDDATKRAVDSALRDWLNNGDDADDALLSRILDACRSSGANGAVAANEAAVRSVWSMLVEGPPANV